LAKLKRLQLRAIRGLRELDLDLEGKSLVIWGENGSGKSSVVDAIEFLTTGSIRHLAGTRGLSVERHGPNVVSGIQEMSVTATFDPGSVEVSRTISGLSPIPEPLQTTWEAGAPGSFVLRRSQLLEFIHADPADRFRVIGSMIGVEVLDDIELALMRGRERRDGELQAERQALTRQRQAIMSKLGRASHDFASLLGALNEAVGQMGFRPAASISELPTVMADWLRSAKQADQDRIRKVTNLKNTAEAAKITEGVLTDARRHHATYSKLLGQRNAIQRLNEADLLQRVLPIIQRGGLAICPVCEQSINQTELVARVQRRLAQLQELSAEFSGFRTRANQLVATLTAASNRLETLRSTVQNLTPNATTEKVTGEIASLLSHTTAVRSQIETSARLGAACDVEAISQTITKCNQLCGQLIAAATKQLGELGLTERDRAILALVEKGSALRQYSEDAAKQQAQVSQAEEFHRRAAYLFDTFSSCKKAEIQAVYEAIEDDVRRFYGSLHPGEPESEFKLLLAEGRRASTELQVLSYGHRVDPRALSSEGHLDSLGLCIFLAFVKQFVPPWPLVVLDDVVMSIDGAHRSRVAELLMTEFADSQLIITTHDEIWFEELVKHQQAFNASSRFSNLRIQRWTLEEGSVLRDHRPRWERIAERLESADKTGAANDSRQFLEWLLTEICVRCLVPVALRRDARYTVEDMLEPARARLKKLLPGEVAKLDELFGEIRAASTPGNLLSHNNANALAVSVEEIRRFSESVKALEEWFACDTCGQLPTYLQQATCIRCVNSRCATPTERKTV
jgi:energy-coupling factor transporter ATP-binding protein EcfA2